MTTRPARVALAGFGTVGRSVAQVLASGRMPELELAVIFNRGISRKKVDWVPPQVTWTERFDDVLAADVDVLVEVVGGLKPAGDFVRAALEAGKSVVTANKQLVAESGAELEELARQRGAELAFEAAVAGGIPVIRTIREGLASDRIQRIAGILNGTCNFILSRMSGANAPFDEALREAQARGFAEADPTDDLTGIDARAKLAILASVGLGQRINPGDIPTRSIASVRSEDLAWADMLRSAIRQLSWVENDEGSVRAWVSPALVPEASRFAHTHEGQNVVVISSELTGEVSLTGPGAGGDATASAVVSDLLAIVRHSGGAAVLRPLPAAFSNLDGGFKAPWYVRFKTSEDMDPRRDFRDILSGLSPRVERVLQDLGSTSGGTVVLMLKPCTFSSADEVVEALAKELKLGERPVSLPVIGSRE
jgi:homoserine dehydrogenase